MKETHIVKGMLNVKVGPGDICGGGGGGVGVTLIASFMRYFLTIGCQLIAVNPIYGYHNKNDINCQREEHTH